MQTIARVLTHHGFGHLVDKLHLSRYVPLRRWKPVLPGESVGPDVETDMSLGRRVASMLEELGPTFVKLGQMLSTRPDVVPAEIVAELSRLQDRVPPFDTLIARQMIEKDLGSPIEESFIHFEAEPFACGSIAQAYHATVRRQSKGEGRSGGIERISQEKSGEKYAEKHSEKLSGKHGSSGKRIEINEDASLGCPVVVKVKRPDIEEIVRLDMVILRWIAELAERWLPEWAIYQPRMIVDEFERTLLREMDFINEAATITRFHEAFGDDPHFRIPAVHWECTGPAVLTLERLGGIAANRLLAEPDPAIDRRALADRLVRAFMRQFFEMGIFHADPHPGNLLISPPANIGLIDFGLTGQIDDEMLGHLIIGLTAAVNRESDVIVEILADMNCLSDHTDRRQLRRAFTELVDKYYGLPLARFDLQTLFLEITGLMRTHSVTLPREFVLMGKALVTIGGICLQWAPEMDLLDLLQPRITDLLAKRLAPTRLAKSAVISGWHLFNILKAAPSQLRDIARRLARGQWQVHIRHQNLDDLAHEIDRASNRLGFSIIVASVVVGSSLVIGNKEPLPVLNVPLGILGVVGYVVAAVMGLWLVINMLRSGKLS
ncbi:MAG: AarF/ABC1/UbiB kinase family protein [Phycisphaerae bacterium]|nr:AarF/ABC1/UbiB kinase family protein [Phycisphaerae bacterium]